MRTCKTCDEEYDDFGQKAALCRPCKREYDRSYHALRSSNAKTRKVETQRIRKKGIHQTIINYLKKNPCVDCGESRIPCLQFDHTNPENKLFTISDMLQAGFSLSRIKAEIKKCVVRCANCHAIITAGQHNWYKGLVV